MNLSWLQLIAIASILLEMVLWFWGKDQLVDFLFVAELFLVAWIYNTSRGQPPADDEEKTLPAVGTVVLAGGLVFFGVSGALYFSGALGGAAVMPVAFVAGCCMVGGVTALVWRA